FRVPSSEKSVPGSSFLVKRTAPYGAPSSCSASPPMSSELHSEGSLGIRARAGRESALNDSFRVVKRDGPVPRVSPGADGIEPFRLGGGLFGGFGGGIAVDLRCGVSVSD